MNRKLQAAKWWPSTTDKALAGAGTNRRQLVIALQKVPLAQREGLRFLLENMPARDLQSLSSQFLLDHVRLAYEGFAKAPWKTRISNALFLNDVLPYSSLTETRDASSQLLQGKARLIVAGAKTPGEAAQRLNAKLFPLVKVRYSTARQRPDQSPIESMSTGLASCSGLSILLVDACRGVGIPARVVGTPMWANGRGNHTWVEIWDGKWQFLGAAEPDEQGLNHGWFVGDAAQARADVPQNAIYATSFKKTGLSFPLVWAPTVGWVNAVNVTSNYTPKIAALNPNETRVQFRVVDAQNRRIASAVAVTDAATKNEVFHGVSKSESSDLNDFLSALLKRSEHYKVSVGGGALQDLVVGNQSEQLVDLTIATVAAPIKAEESAQLKMALQAYFSVSSAQQNTWKFSPTLQNLLRDHEEAVRQIAWEAYRAAPIHQKAKQDFDGHQVSWNQYLSPYTFNTVGTRPKNGWGLVIAMHGGGGTAKEVNDEQWRGMQSHYKDHPEAGGYVYLALRAPNDTWNGFYDDYVYPLVANLIQQWTLFGDIDPNKVDILGYSHGGYGAYAIGPKMPDRFAAIHASAGAATDGETAALNLRNTPFSAMVGEFDTAYDRLERNKRFDQEIRALRGTRTDIYPVHIDVMAGFQHGNLRDGDMLVEMLPAVRNAVPHELSWLMTDSVISDFFWLRTDSPAKTREVRATCRDNKIEVNLTNTDSIKVFLDRRLVDFDKPVTVVLNGQKREMKVAPNLLTFCQTLARRGDPQLAFSAEIDLHL
ncbi:transglutaminase domain-containing protein [Abditibacterium utsteinense]|nr:transglutaminase domain-containing protein [Abditibacterium utsteinense]